MVGAVCRNAIALRIDRRSGPVHRLGCQGIPPPTSTTCHRASLSSLAAPTSPSASCFHHPLAVIHRWPPTLGAAVLVNNGPEYCDCRLYVAADSRERLGRALSC